MKKRSIIFLSGAVFLVLAAWIPVSRGIAWQHDYAEAEALVPVVWPLAGEMERFTKQNGRLPGTLGEIDTFSTNYDFSCLAVYHPDFAPQKGRIFYLEVNRRFAFEIDKTFAPKWARFTGVIDKPLESALPIHWIGGSKQIQITKAGTGNKWNSVPDDWTIDLNHSAVFETLATGIATSGSGRQTVNRFRPSGT